MHSFILFFFLLKAQQKDIIEYGRKNNYTERWWRQFLFEAVTSGSRAWFKSDKGNLIFLRSLKQSMFMWTSSWRSDCSSNKQPAKQNISASLTGRAGAGRNWTSRSLFRLLCSFSCQPVNCVSVKYKEIWCFNEVKINTTLSVSFLSNQGSTQAQTPSPCEGQQLHRDGEWSAWLQINPYCHHDCILLTHTNTPAVHSGSHNGANGYWLEIWVGLCVPK